MKKLLFFGLFIILLSSLVSAGGLPYLISGTVTMDGTPVSGIRAQATDLLSGRVITGSTGGNGIYTIDVEDRGRFRLSVCEGKPECHKEVAVYDATPQKVNFVFGDLSGDTTTTFVWNGKTIIAAVLALIITGGLGTYGITQKINRSKLEEALIEEVIQNAENIAIGKMKDIKKKGLLSSHFKTYAIVFEQGYKNRTKVLDFLRG